MCYNQTMSLKNSNFIQKAFDITKENIILAQPFIIFMIVLSFTLAGLAMQANSISYIVFLITNILLCCAFFSGWFYMIKQGIYLDKRIQNGEYRKPEDRASASLALSKEFFPGVGEYFLQVTTTITIYVIFYFLVMFLFYKLGQHILPNPHIDINKLYSIANASPAEVQKFVYSLSFEQLRAINLWMIFMGSTMCAFSFVTMFIFPAIYDTKDRNKKEFFLFAPFLAFKRNIVFIFKNFFGSLGIILFLLFLNTVLSILSLIFNLNIVLAIIGLLISFYFITYGLVLIFLYYEERKN